MYILQTGNEHFDKNLKKGFQTFWTITDYEFIDNIDQIDTKDKSISYLSATKMTIEDSYSTQTYNRYGILLGGDESFLFKNVADIILDNFGYEKHLTEAAYRAFSMPKMMQDFIQMRIDGEPISGSTITRVRYTAGLVYNKKSTDIKKKTLLVIDCESGSLLYNGYQPNGIGVTKKDVKRLSKAVNGKVN